jgi:hypothetical protein
LVQGACDAAFSKVALGPRDSMEVQFSDTWDFKALYTTYMIPVKYFRYSDHVDRGVLKLDKRTYWRTRVVPYVEVQIPTGIMAWGGKGYLRINRVGNAEAPSLYRMDGSRIPARVSLVAGSWLLEPIHAEAGLILIRSGNGGNGGKGAK